MTSLNNYSKWDKIQLSSDDDEDCHPNIEKYTWRRLRAQQRQQQREKDDHEAERVQAQIKALEQKIADLKKFPASATTAAGISRHESEIKSLKSYLDKQAAVRKLTPEELCKDSFDSTKVNKNAELEHPTPPALQKRLDEGPQVTADGFSAWHKANDGLLKQYLECQSLEASRDFITKHPQLLDPNATGWILLHALEQEMGGDTPAMVHAVRQNQFLQYPMDLAKLSKGMSNLEAAKSFFSACEGRVVLLVLVLSPSLSSSLSSSLLLWAVMAGRVSLVLVMVVLLQSAAAALCCCCCCIVCCCW
jgi:cell division cycle protein 37